MVDLNKLSTLKDKLMMAKDFRDPWNYFFDHLGENPEFMKLGKRAKGTVLKQILAKIGEELFETPTVAVTHLLLTKLSKYRFLHGGCFIQGRMATVMFFEDIDMGLAAVAMGGDYTMFARFTSIKMDTGNKEVFFVPGAGSNSIN